MGGVMKRYKLLKDLPTFKAGDLFYISEYGALVYDDGYGGVMAYARQTLDMFPNILTEWFEEIQEPTDSIHWMPKNGDIYWFVGMGGKINHDFWTGTPADFWRYGLGRIYRTKEECRKSRDRELAEVRLRRTSTFEPDFENGNGGWIVEYDYVKHRLAAWRYPFENSGEPVRYETKEDALKSIKENREDWLAYFNVEDC
jgi:hypothetical protein